MLEDNLARLPTAYTNPPGNLSLARYIVDPETGLLDERESGDGVKSNLVFSLTKKLEWLAKYSQTFPNAMLACDHVGITHETYRNHLMIDPKFFELCRTVAMRRVYEVETKSFEMAMKDNGVIDRMSIKRAFIPELYNPDRKIVISTNDRPSVDDARARMKRLQGAIDGEIVKQSLELTDDRITKTNNEQ